jgi:hypothetical protein
MIGAILATTMQVENVHKCQSYMSAKQLITTLESNNEVFHQHGPETAACSDSVCSITFPRHSQCPQALE